MTNVNAVEIVTARGHGVHRTLLGDGLVVNYFYLLNRQVGIHRRHCQYCFRQRLHNTQPPLQYYATLRRITVVALFQDSLGQLAPER